MTNDGETASFVLVLCPFKLGLLCMRAGGLLNCSDRV